MHSRLLASAVLLTACVPELPPFPEGSTTGTTSTGSTTSSSATVADDTVAEPSSTGLGPLLDVGPGPPACIDCAIVIDSKQSGELDVTGEDIFATAQLEGHTVYAMGTFGTGRFIATADTSLPLAEQTDCPVLAWLAGSYDPGTSILVFGWSDPLEFMEIEYPPQIHLPAEYIGDPDLLAEDYDVVVYFEESSYLDEGEQPSDEELETVLDFVQSGGGLVVSSEYSERGGGYLTPEDIESVNRLMVPLGVQTLAISLNWGEVESSIEFPCFPPVG